MIGVSIAFLPLSLITLPKNIYLSPSFNFSLMYFWLNHVNLHTPVSSATYVESIVSFAFLKTCTGFTTSAINKAFSPTISSDIVYNFVLSS